MDRRQYAELNGPTTGDGVRLADTNLVAIIESDATVYGEEVSFGGGKVIRDGMGHNGRLTAVNGIPDLVITNALIIDYTGVFKADIAVKDAKMLQAGSAGDPDTPYMIAIVVGGATERIGGEGFIITAGAIDTHIHDLSPDRVGAGRDKGTTTFIGGGTGPLDSSNAPTV